MREKQMFLRCMTFFTAMFFVSFIYLIVSDRRAPFTTEGRVYGQVVQIASEVTSRVTDVLVENNEEVKTGDILFILDSRKFEIALDQAELALQSAKESELALRAKKSAAIANISRVKASLNNAKSEYQRISKLAKHQAVSVSELESKKKQYQIAIADLEIEKQNLNKLNAQLNTGQGVTTDVLVAQSRLEKAKLDISNTVVRSPSDGTVTNLRLEVGTIANANMPLLTFVTDDSLWVAADFREKSVSKVTNDYHALVTFDAFPGKVYQYHVDSRDRGVSSGHQNPNGMLTQIEVNNRWVRDAQRTRINLESNELLPDSLFIGSRASLALYSGESRFWQLIAKTRIRLISWFHFIY
ncbi:multidrug transporter [Vibrio inusitatus NBRC 102082]|uniref:Multidrug transporter n=1 Tax=Vibrio inusitatus NBRC 102082 TaxID=1219070 RepID=A0A4Y3HV59_9VIBR|nr:HlyD family secretion protein [Vibrio inusitatus]GEA50976.1 multidrug transporter [Vibrio inusitatus NBRC 102082]